MPSPQIFSILATEKGIMMAKLLMISGLPMIRSFQVLLGGTSRRMVNQKKLTERPTIGAPTTQIQEGFGMVHM